MKNLRFKTFLFSWIGATLAFGFAGWTGTINIFDFGTLGVIAYLAMAAIFALLLWLYFKTNFDENLRPLRRKV